MPKAALITTNPAKLGEYQSYLGKVGNWKLSIIAPGQTPADIFAQHPDIRLIVCDRMMLYDKATDQALEQPAHGQLLINRCVVEAYFSKDGGDTPRIYTAEEHGWFDEHTHSKGGFGWDGHFRTFSTGMTYAEAALAGFKTSSRQQALALLCADIGHIADSERGTAYISVEAAETIRFDRSQYDALTDNALILTPHPKAPWLTGLMRKSFESGIVFRRAANRREKNYWLPGLNAGLPLTRKKDAVHEATFMAHDVFHFLNPDLILVPGPFARQTYAIHRMIGEAFTLCLADMLYVDGLAASGIDYDWSARRIYPLFNAINFDWSLDSLRRLLLANVRLCLLGDESGWIDLGAKPEDLATFRAKYDSFFINDWVWTGANADALQDNENAMQSWLTLISPLREKCGLSTTAEAPWATAISSDMDMERAIMAVADIYVDYLLKMITTADPGQIDRLNARSNGFRRWIAGQVMAFSRHPHIPALRPIAAALVQMATADTFDGTTIARARLLYEEGLKILIEAKVLPSADFETCRQIYPMFDPVYVFYGQDDFADIRSAAAFVLEKENKDVE